MVYRARIRQDISESTKRCTVTRKDIKMNATIILYDHRKKWGFLQPDDKSKEEVFFHLAAVEIADRDLIIEGARATYENGTFKGRSCGKNIHIIKDIYSIEGESIEGAKAIANAPVTQESSDAIQ